MYIIDIAHLAMSTQQKKPLKINLENEMRTIDIRNETGNEIEEIYFADGKDVTADRLYMYSHHKKIGIKRYGVSAGVDVFITDIPNLIKALKKAQELLGEKKSGL